MDKVDFRCVDSYCTSVIELPFVNFNYSPDLFVGHLRYRGVINIV